MKNLIVTLLFATLSIVYAKSDDNPYYSQITQGMFENYVGKWNVIYANETESGLPSTGRGISVSTLTMGKTVLRFENALEYRQNKLISYFIVGYDKFKKDYYFISYDNASTTPILLTGKYDEKSNSFEFRDSTYNTKSKDGSRMVIEFERKDKLLFTYYVSKDGKERKVLNMAFVKK